MKNLICFIAAIVLICNVAFGQKSTSPLEVIVGGTFAKPKIIPALDKLALAQIKVQYNLTTTTRTVGTEKSTGQIAGAKLTAFLETTDGKLTDEDFQGITDHFYTYFAQKLNAAGISTVDWNTIAAAEFFTDGAEKDPAGKGNTAANASSTSVANKGTVMYGGGLAFAFGKANKASAFCKKIGAPAAFFNLTVDFADVMLDVDIKTATSGLYSVPTSRTWKYNSAVRADMMVVPTDANSNTLFWNEKSGAESLWLRKDIVAGVEYHENISQDPSRMKNSMWAFSKEMNPVVIETTRAKYIAAAKKALENYADTFVALHTELKNK